MRALPCHAPTMPHEPTGETNESAKSALEAITNAFLKYALLGLEYEGHPGLPEPTNLKTADRRWIEETMPQSKTGEGGWCTTLRPVPVPTLPIPTS